MTLIFREEKGSPLTRGELDQNFRDLDQRLTSLEKISGPLETIQEIYLEGDEWIIKGTHGSLLGRCRFPVLLFHPRGSWEPDQDYSVYDLVQEGSKILCCLKNHRSSKFLEEQAFWTTLIDLQALSSGEREKSGSKRLLPLYTSTTLPE